MFNKVGEVIFECFRWKIIIIDFFFKINIFFVKNILITLIGKELIFLLSVGFILDISKICESLKFLYE